MTSARRLFANRANARKSTGPRTAAGKMQAASNARRHGLSVPVLRDRALANGIASLARAIAGVDADAQRHATASRIAAGQVDVLRVRRAARTLMAQAPGNAKLIERLATLEDYERRARSRRKLAMQEFDDLLGSQVGPLGDQSH